MGRSMIERERSCTRGERTGDGIRRNAEKALVVIESGLLSGASLWGEERLFRGETGGKLVSNTRLRSMEG